MRCILTWVFTCFLLSTIAQNHDHLRWEKLMSQGLELSENGAYQQGVHYLIQAYQLADSIFTENDWQLGTTSYRTGQVLHILEDYEQALIYLKRAKKIYQTHKFNQYP